MVGTTQRTLYPLVFLLLACKGGPEVGSQRGKCYPNSTCNKGLACRSGLCVKADPATALGEAAKTIVATALTKHQAKAKAIEATEGLAKIAIGAKAYFHADHYDTQGTLLPKRFPKGSTAWTPETPCCKQPGRMCKADATLWKQAPWPSLFFQMTEAHRYQWRFSSSGSGAKASYVAEARGDLGCNGTYSSYKITGKVVGKALEVRHTQQAQNALE